MTEVTLGGLYRDGEGQTYTVLGLHGSLVKVLYLGGATELIGRPEHLRRVRVKEHADEVKRRVGRRAKLVNDLFLDPFTLGWLAAKGWLYAQMPASREKEFIEEHVAITGARPDEGSYHVWAPEERVDGTWEAMTTTIAFPMHGELELPDDVTVTPQDSDRAGVSSVRLLWALLLLGFRLGSGQDLDEIRARVALRHDVDEFDKGVKEATK